eukprot:SAG31_NODE_22098_length_533_cov_43.264977_1_plen_90_part_01
MVATAPPEDATAPPQKSIFKNTESLCFNDYMYCSVSKSIRYLTNFKILTPVLPFTVYFTRGYIKHRGGGNSRGSYAKFETQPGSGGDVTI